MRGPGTWRRLKIAAEIRIGHGLPRLPESELVRLLGLLAAIRDHQAAAVLDDDGAQERRGAAEIPGLDAEPLADACVRLAKAVDVRPFL
jgi:hypothetical protein